MHNSQRQRIVIVHRGKRTAAGCFSERAGKGSGRPNDTAQLSATPQAKVPSVNREVRIRLSSVSSGMWLVQVEVMSSDTTHAIV